MEVKEWILIMNFHTDVTFTIILYIN